MKRIIVGVDGSANSREAAAVAADLARATGATVVAVHAVGLLERLASNGEHISSRKRRRQITEEMESEWCVPLAGLPVDHRIIDGSSVSALLGAVEGPDDLIVVGRRGSGGFSGSSLGSTSAEVAQRSPVAVLIVPEAVGSI
ncbi:MAG: universal stress protein [Actinomycetia bacterium]|nr:universal stress protein [Actinomycetes bacterium]MCP4222127.1 universal stress protein [Actinomycetes bacterium]MCP5033829.1 universal stress protein [Actinomycetes bacterium]